MPCFFAADQFYLKKLNNLYPIFSQIGYYLAR